MKDTLNKLIRRLEKCNNELENISKETYNIQRNIEEWQDTAELENAPMQLLEKTADTISNAVDQTETVREEIKTAIKKIRETIILTEKIQKHYKENENTNP